MGWGGVGWGGRRGEAGGVEIHERSNDYNKDVMTFQKKGSRSSREVLHFIKKLVIIAGR